MKIKISAIQEALKTLGYLHLTHDAGGEWDRSTSDGYRMACLASNMSESQASQQPTYASQLPESIRGLISGDAKPEADAKAKAEADAKAKAEADAKAKAEADAKAKAEADAKAETKPEPSFNVQSGKSSK